jgi:sec-independent protein translocase protein TatC
MLPPLIDLPMGLGDHLDELRRRLMWPVITVAVIFVVAFGFQGYLKEAMVWPLLRSIQIVGPVEAKLVGLPITGDFRILTAFSLSEAASTAAQISFYLALAVAAPVVLWNLWQFIAVGLTSTERRLAFLFVPFGVIMFYLGMIIGYFFGLPYFYAFLIEYSASDPTIIIQLRQSEYIDMFFLWTVSFGLIMDIPWLIIVLVRTGLFHPDQLARSRKFIIMLNLILAAVIAPPGDVTSMLALFVPMQFLFESGLLASRFFIPKPSPVVEIERE